MMTDGGQSSGKWETFVRIATVMFAIGIIVILILLIQFMLMNADSDEITWQRYIYLLSGLEAIAFAAAGYLFGREVHRGQAEQAQTRAREANERASNSDARAEQEASRANEAETQARQEASRASDNAQRTAAFRTAYEAVRTTISHMAGKHRQQRVATISSVQPLTPHQYRARQDAPDRGGIRFYLDTPDQTVDVMGDNIGDLVAGQYQRESLQNDIEELATLVNRLDTVVGEQLQSAREPGPDGGENAVDG